MNGKQLSVNLITVLANTEYRLGRLGFLARLLFIFTLMFNLTRLIFITSNISYNFALMAILLPSLIIYTLTITIRRLHDMNQNGSPSFIILIPGINIIYATILSLKKGDPSPNQYGSPIPALLWEKILGWMCILTIFPMLFILLMRDLNIIF